MTKASLLEWADQVAPALWHHRRWGLVRPFLRLEEHGKSTRHKRIEVAPMPEDVRAAALSVVVRCAACGEPIHPIRSRKAARLRGEPSAHCFYSGTCSLERPGCSKTKAAHLHHSAMVRLLEAASPLIELVS